MYFTVNRRRVDSKNFSQRNWLQVFSAAVGNRKAGNYSILTRGETAERILFVSLLKKEAYKYDEAACDIFRATVPCRRP